MFSNISSFSSSSIEFVVSRSYPLNKENIIIESLEFLEPSNIIIDMNGVLKLIDFDAARVYKVDVNRDTVILGTEGYISPEQLGYSQTDGRSDIYSLGVLLNVLLTGKMPREELHIGKLTGIVEKCIKLSPELRYNKVLEVYIALQNTINVNEKSDGKILKDQIKPVNNREIFERENKKIAKFISLVKSLPGYRRGKPLNILLGTLLYIFLSFGLFLSYENGFSLKSFIENLAVVAFILMLVFLYSNFQNIQSKLPLLRSDDRKKRYTGKIIYFFIIFLITGIILEVSKFF